MGKMVKDLDRGILPPRFMHRVGRGEERVVIPDGNIGRVVKVAPSVLRPRPAQPSGRDGDLTFARANDGLERDPSGSSLVALCFYVLEHRRLRAPRQVYTFDDRRHFAVRGPPDSRWRATTRHS